MLYLFHDRFLMSPTKDASSTRKCKSQAVRQPCKPVVYSDCSMLWHVYWLPKGNKWPSILDKLYSKLAAEHIEIASINFLACPISCSWPTWLQRGLEAGCKFLRQRRWCLSSGSGWGGHAEDRALWRGSVGWLPDLPWLLGNAKSHRERQGEGRRTGNTALLGETYKKLICLHLNHTSIHSLFWYIKHSVRGCTYKICSAPPQNSPIFHAQRPFVVLWTPQITVRQNSFIPCPANETVGSLPGRKGHHRERQQNDHIKWAEYKCFNPFHWHLSE